MTKGMYDKILQEKFFEKKQYLYEKIIYKK